MKAKVLLITLTVIILLCGCQPTSVENTNTASPTPTNTGIKGKAGEVIIENGEYFLRVYNGEKYTVPCTPDVKWNTSFDSVQEIKRTIKENDFTDSKIELLYFGLDPVAEDRGLFPIIDPDKMVYPTFDGQENYFRLGIKNRVFWGSMDIVCNDKKLILEFESYYPQLMDDKFGILELETDPQNNSNVEYLEYSQDGFKKRAWVRSNGSKIARYDAVTGNKLYRVTEMHYNSGSVYYTLYGIIDGVGGFKVSCYDLKNEISADDLKWIMESIELKKA